MPWLSILKLLLSLASSLSNYLREKQLLDAGEAKAISKYTSDALSSVKAATEAKRKVSDNVIDITKDPHNRDNQ